ncbi:MAG: ATP-binding protein, partial [Pseudonocardiaceae bacterium]
MHVSIDSSRPYRWPSELIELVEAVTRTDPKNESTCIEWKSTLDLGDKSGHYHVAKHVLGFANRTVSTASLHADGHAYMIVGAEPGNLAGIEPIDPAVLRPKILRYVGPAVRWRAEYMSVRGRQVLVVIVDPPEHGDPVHPVRHQLDTHPKGRILVRRPGSTDPADEFEIDQLVQRVRSGGGGLEISIEPIFPVVEHRPSLPNVDELTDAERAATLARPRADAPRPSHPGEPFGVMAALQSQAAAMTAMFEEPDKRSDEEYQQEVDHYSKAYSQALRARCLWRLAVSALVGSGSGPLSVIELARFVTQRAGRACGVGRSWRGHTSVF